MLELDGTAAGGQYLRRALALSMLTDTPVTVEHVRDARPEPGLKPQHLAAVEAAGQACEATVEGATHGSETVTFEPGPLSGGTVEVDIDTAGSIALVFDTLLPLALCLDEPLTVTATGGTDVTWSPPMLTYQHVKLPLLRSLGVLAAVDVERAGFYPVGGGAATLRLGPSTPRPLTLDERDDIDGIRVYSTASHHLADAEVAQRQATAAIDALEDTDLPVRERAIQYVDADSPGSVCCVRADCEQSLAGFDALGEKGKPAEEVGREAAEHFLAFERTDAVVDSHLADQLLVVLAVAGGRLRIPGLTAHVETSLDLLSAFGYDVGVERDGGESVLLRA